MLKQYLATQHSSAMEAMAALMADQANSQYLTGYPNGKALVKEFVPLMIRNIE